MNNLIIRPAEISDARDVAEIRQTSWRATYAGLIPDYYFERFDLEKETKRFEKFFETKNTTFVLEFEKKPVGFFSVHKTSPHLDGHNFDGNIGGFYILPQFQRQGFGTKAIEFIKQHFKKQGAKTFSVFCLKTNEKGRKFYEKSGGILVGEKLFDDLLEVCYKFEI